jgi:hypothetical protein
MENESVLTPERIEDWRKVLDAKYEQLCQITGPGTTGDQLRMHVARFHVNELCALALDGLKYRAEKR